MNTAFLLQILIATYTDEATLLHKNKNANNSTRWLSYQNQIHKVNHSAVKFQTGRLKTRATWNVSQHSSTQNKLHRFQEKKPRSNIWINECTSTSNIQFLKDSHKRDCNIWQVLSCGKIDRKNKCTLFHFALCFGRTWQISIVWLAVTATENAPKAGVETVLGKWTTIRNAKMP